MNPQTVFIFSVPVFVLLMTLPIIVLVLFAAFKKVKRLTNKQAILVWTCLIGYYSVFFTQVPKLTRPYFAQHSHEVTECTTRVVINDE